MMLDAIKFVRGATKDTDSISPVLTHFCIYDGRIQGTDGRIHIDVACPELTFNAVVPAEKFLRAVDACDKDPSFRFTETNKLVVECKPFKAFLPNLPVTDFPKGEPSTGKKIKVPDNLIPVLRILLPFLSTDASRAWAGTIFFHRKSGKAFAANNAIIAVYKAKDFFEKDTQLPIFLIEELLRIDERPKFYSKDEVSITFFWENRWLRSALINAEWPINTAVGYLTADGDTNKLPIPKNLQANISKILPFCTDPKFPVIHFTKDGIATAPGEIQAEITGFNIGVCALRADNIEPMLKHSQFICATEKVVMFWGTDFRGFMAPLRT